MASPLIDLLSGSARAALPFLEAGVEAGLSANEMLRSLSDAGLGIRRAEGLAIIRGLTEQVSGRAYIQSVRNDLLPNPLRFTPATTFISGTYSYLVRVTGTDILTGEKRVQQISVTTDNLLTKDEAAAAGLDAIAAREGSYGIEPDGAIVTQALINPLFVSGP